MRNKPLLFLIASGLAFAGESIQLSTTTAGNSSIPAQAPGHPWRIEFTIHNWNSNFTGNTHPLDGSAVGANISVLNLGGGDLRLQIYSSSSSGGAVCIIPGLGSGGPGGGGSVATNSFLTVRFQEDPVGKVDYCQAWDINGVNVLNQSIPYVSNTGSNTNGAFVGGTGQNVSTAYFRIYTSVVATNARPPVTADTTANCLVIWKFDLGNNTGSLNDSCTAGPYNAVMSAGSPVYVPTPGQTLVMPVLKTANAPSWNNWATFRAGFPNQLDGTASYSQADASPNVSCFWQALSGPSASGIGPSALIWDSHSSCMPTVQGLIFGQYTFQLVVTDVNGVQVTATQALGAVATDSNGVVINADPNVDFLFGPLIAFGQNPWGYQDYWAMHATQLRLTDYTNPVPGVVNYPNPWITSTGAPQWESTGQGTVSYYFNCVGGQYFCNGSHYSGTLTVGCIVGAASCAASTVAGLDLTAFPTHIILYDGAASAEVRICSNTGNTLNVCYDGWGNSTAHTFNTGTSVLQSKVTGAGTAFLTDPITAVCPLGAPGPPGPSLYSTGTITLTANSSNVTGSGTTFTSLMAGDYIRVAATHSGTAFIFVAQIATFNSATSLTLNRVYPADADTTSGLAYNIMLAQRTIVLRYPHATDPTGVGEILFGVSGGCESETAVYTNPVFQGNSFASGHDIPAVDGHSITVKVYSITDTSGWVNQSSTGGISFYGESLAHRALYYRSGLTSALTAANYISDYWIKSPWGNAEGAGYPFLFTGGEAIGGFVSAVLTGRVSWSDLRSYGTAGLSAVNGIASQGCNAWQQADTRDVGYAYAWVVLAAIYDPDTTSTAAPGGIPWRTYWQNSLAQMRTNDANCQRADNSFANGFNWNTTYGVWNMTNGSTAVTGTSIPPSLCNGTAAGKAFVINGSNTIHVLTGALPTGTNQLFLTGTTTTNTVVPFVQSTSYGGGLLGVLWMGDTGDVSWVSGNIDGYPGDGSLQDMLTIATSNDDVTDLQKNWACTWNSPTSVTLNRPWDSPSSDSSHIYYPFILNLAGYGQQPFMLGIKSLGENWLATQTLPALTSYVPFYQTLTLNSTQWIWNVGMDHELLGTNYGRIFQQCEPTNIAPSGTSFTFRATGCTYGNDPTAVTLSREQNSETGAAQAIYYANNPSMSNRNLGDKFYGSLWGDSAFNTGGVFQDANSAANNPGVTNLTDPYIHSGKWTGFFAGIGMSARWPAIRLGGVQSAQPRTVYISVRVADVRSAASVKVLITAPSSAQTSFSCSTEPCAVTIDARQGAHWYQVQYLSASGAVLSQSQPALLFAN